MFYRASGVYTQEIYRNILTAKVSGLKRTFIYVCSGGARNRDKYSGITLLHVAGGRGARMVMYSLASSKSSNVVTRWGGAHCGRL